MTTQAGQLTGPGVGECYVCGHVTGLRWRNVYVCDDHLADARRDDVVGKGPPVAGPRFVRDGFEKLADIGLRQRSIPGLRATQAIVDAAGEKVAEVDAIEPTIGRSPLQDVRDALTAGEAAYIAETIRGLGGVELPPMTVGELQATMAPGDDPDPLHLDGWDPVAKRWETPSGAYEGPRQPEPDTIDPADW